MRMSVEEPAFVMLDSENAERRTRRMAGSVSSRYLNYNSSDTTAITSGMKR